VDWEDARSLSGWPPLDDLFPDARPLHDSLYHVGEEQYAFVSDVDQQFTPDQPGRPFVTLLLWAATDEAARRCTLVEPQAQVPRTSKVPPAVLLLGSDGRYSSLLETKVVRGVGNLAEQAIYDNSGNFVHKVIAIKGFSFYFIERVVTDDEMPYAIEVRFG